MELDTLSFYIMLTILALTGLYPALWSCCKSLENKVDRLSKRILELEDNIELMKYEDKYLGITVLIGETYYTVTKIELNKSFPSCIKYGNCIVILSDVNGFTKRMGLKTLKNIMKIEYGEE